MLINLIGCDGCGKTTQAELLQPWIERTFRCRVRSLRKKDIFDFDAFPDSRRLFGCSYKELMYQLLPRMKDESRALFLFYMLSLSACNYPPGANEVVLVDGGWDKHVATEAAYGLDPAWLGNLASFFPRPDVTIFLDIDPETVVRRRHENAYGAHAPYECGGAEDISDAAFVRHMSKVAIRLQTMAQAEGWTRIDARSSKEAVFELVRLRLSDAISASLARAGDPHDAAPLKAS